MVKAPNGTFSLTQAAKWKQAGVIHSFHQVLSAPLRDLIKHNGLSMDKNTGLCDPTETLNSRCWRRCRRTGMSRLARPWRRLNAAPRKTNRDLQFVGGHGGVLVFGRAVPGCSAFVRGFIRSGGVPILFFIDSPVPMTNGSGVFSFFANSSLEQPYF